MSFIGKFSIAFTQTTANNARAPRVFHLIKYNRDECAYGGDQAGDCNWFNCHFLYSNNIILLDYKMMYKKPCGCGCERTRPAKRDPSKKRNIYVTVEHKLLPVQNKIMTFTKRRVPKALTRL